MSDGDFGFLRRCSTELISKRLTTEQLWQAHIIQVVRWEISKSLNRWSAYIGRFRGVQTKCTSSIVFPEKNRTLSYCANCRKLIDFMIWDSYPILCMNGCVVANGDATIISTLGTYTSYWWVETNYEFETKPRSCPIMTLSVLHAFPSDWKMRLEQFNEQ